MRGARLAAAGLVAWAAGNVLAEAIAQGAAYFLLIVALARGRRSEIAADVRRFSAAAALLAAWQALSPAVARWSGSAPSWPRSGRYGQLFDTIAPALAAAAAPGAPWVALAWVVSLGWGLSTALGTFQHFVRWPFAQPGWFRTPIDRVRESFSSGGSPVYGAGGFLFHRLRFAHGAVATLGAALAVAARTTKPPIAAAAAATCAALLAAPYLAYARAALVVAFAMTVAALLWLWPRRRRKWVLAAVAAIALAVAASPEWRTRFVGGTRNLLGEDERRLSMHVAVELVRQHPLLGVGFGNYEEAALATRQVTGVTPLLAIDAHNMWLTTWAETGVVGLLLTVAYHALLGRALWRRMRARSWAAAGGLLSFAGFHLLSLVHYLQHHTGVYLSFALAWGLGLAPPESTESPQLGLDGRRAGDSAESQSAGWTPRAAGGSSGGPGGNQP